MGRDNESTTKFKVDISELKSAMQEARKQVAHANSEFNAVASTMEDWAKSSDGLSAKLRQLESKLESEKAVLEEYEKVLEEVKREYGENSQEALEYSTRLNNQTAAVNRIEREISGYRDRLEEVAEAERVAARTGRDVAEVLADTGEEADNAEGGFTILKGAVADFVGNALTRLAEGLKNAIGSLISFGDEADRAMNKLTAKTGLYTDGMDDFKDVMENIYKANYGESFEDIADAMSEVMTQSWNWDTENIEEVTKNAITLRDTFDMEVSGSMKAANVLMEEFGITSDEAFNLIARGAQVGLNKNGDLLDVINEYGVHYSQMGASAEEFFQSLNNGAIDGAFSVDKVGDAYKEFGIRVKDTSQTTTDAYEALGLNADKMRAKFAEGGESARAANDEVLEALFAVDDQVKRNEIGVSLFGTMWEDLGERAVRSLVNIGDDGSDAFIDVYDTMNQINEIRYDSVGEAFQGIGRNIQTSLLMPISEKLLPVVSDLAAKFQEWINDQATQAAIQELTDSVSQFIDNGLMVLQEFVQWFLENKDAVIAGLAGIGAGFLAFKVVSLIQGVTSAMKGMTLAQYALNLAMSLNPIGIIVSLIAGLVTAFVVLWNKSDSFRGFWLGLWETIKEKVSSFVDTIKRFFTETIPKFFQSLINWVKTNWKNILLFLINPFAGMFKYFYENNSKFREFVDNAIAQIKQLPTKIGQWFTATIAKIIAWKDEMILKAGEAGSNFVQSIVTFFEELPYKIGYVIGLVIGQIIQWGTDIYAFITVKIPEIINSISTFFSELPGKVWTWLVSTATKISQWASDVLVKAKKTGSEFIATVVTFFSQLPGKVWTWLVNTLSKISQWAINMVTKAKEAGSKFLNKVIEYVTQLPEKVQTWLTNTISKLTTWVSDMGKKGKEAISELLAKVVEGAKSIPEKMLSIGQDIVNGVWKGIQNAKDQFFENVKGFFSGLVDGAKNALGIKSPSKLFAKEVGKWIPPGIAVGITDNAKSALKSMKDLAVNMVSTAKDSLYGATVNLGGTGATATLDAKAGAGSKVVNNYFTQYNNSPKQLSRLEIYRQTKNLLGYAGGGN